MSRKTLPVGDLVFEVRSYPYPKDASCACGRPATDLVLLNRLAGDAVLACLDCAKKYFGNLRRIKP